MFCVAGGLKLAGNLLKSNDGRLACFHTTKKLLFLRRLKLPLWVRMACLSSDCGQMSTFQALL